MPGSPRRRFTAYERDTVVHPFSNSQLCIPVLRIAARSLHPHQTMTKSRVALLSLILSSLILPLEAATYYMSGRMAMTPTLEVLDTAPRRVVNYQQSDCVR